MAEETKTTKPPEPPKPEARGDTKAFAPQASEEVDRTTIEYRLNALRDELGFPKSGPIEWGKHLVLALKAVYIDPSEQGVVRRIKDAIAKRYNDPSNRHKPANHEDRHLTSLEVVHLLKQNMMDMPHLTSDRT